MNRETFSLSQKELQRVAVISACIKGEMACARAAELLCLSVRQIKRLKKRLREDGEAALAHASRGRPSPRRLPVRMRDRILHLARTRYVGTLVPPLRHQQQPLLDNRRSFAVEDIRVDTQLLDQAKAAGYSTKVLFISTEVANLNVGRVLVRMSRGGQAVPVSSVIDSYRESTKDLSEVPKHADELLVYDNTAHRRGFRVVARFIGGKLSKTAQTIPDWAARVFGKGLHAAKQHEKPGRER